MTADLDDVSNQQLNLNVVQLSVVA